MAQPGYLSRRNKNKLEILKHRRGLPGACPQREDRITSLGLPDIEPLAQKSQNWDVWKDYKSFKGKKETSRTIQSFLLPQSRV